MKLGLHPSHLPLGVMLDQDEKESRTPRERVHPVQPGRRLPLSGRRQGRRPGRLRRSRAGGPPEPRARDRRLGGAPGDRPRRSERHRGGRQVRRRLDGPDHRGRRGGVLRRPQLGPAAAPVLPTTPTPRASPTAPTRSGRNYVRHNNAAVIALSRSPEPDPAAEDPRPQRLVPEGRGLGLSVGQHPDARQVRRRAAPGDGAALPGLGSQAHSGRDVERSRTPRRRLLDVVGRPSPPRQPDHPRQGRARSGSLCPRTTTGRG